MAEINAKLQVIERRVGQVIEDAIYVDQKVRDTDVMITNALEEARKLLAQISSMNDIERSDLVADEEIEKMNVLNNKIDAEQKVEGVPADVSKEILLSRELYGNMKKNEEQHEPDSTPSCEKNSAKSTLLQTINHKKVIDSYTNVW